MSLGSSETHGPFMGGEQLLGCTYIFWGCPESRQGLLTQGEVSPSPSSLFHQLTWALAATAAPGVEGEDATA